MIKNFRKKNQKKAVTLIELVIAVIIVSIIATIGIGRYEDAVKRNRFREARSNILLIRTTQEIFRSKNGAYYPLPVGSNVQKDTVDINADLGLDLLSGPSSYIRYRCNRLAGYSADKYYCRAQCFSGPGLTGSIIWYLRVIDGGMPTCVNGTETCP